MKSFGGRILFLDRADINTDEIIPAKYLTEISREALKPYLLEDLSLEGFHAARDSSTHQVIITRSNFGCGSSREHAPWALEVNGINLVIAENFARIFRQNMYNCGMMAVELPADVIDMLFRKYAKGEASLEADMGRRVFIITGSGEKDEVPFIISDFDSQLVESEGWVDFADSRY